MTPGLPSLHIDAAVATIRLNRPAVHNRLEPEDLDELDRLLGAVAQQPALRAVLLTATGPSFSSGYNIGKLREAGAGVSLDAVTDRLERLPLPTVCAMNGSVYGGATDLALACDFRIGVHGMVLVMPAARLGLHYYEGGLRRSVARLGLAAAKRLFLTAARQDTAELLRIGYLDEAVPPEDLLPRAHALAATLAANAPLAVQGMKRSLNDIARGEASGAAIAAGVARCAGSADLREGQAAWLEKRAPHFTGQ